MRGELFSIVVSDCFDAVSERQEHACAGLHDRVRVLVRQFGELGVFGGSLDMRHDNAFVIGADNRVGLPVSDAAFCGDNRRPLIDIDAVRNQPAPRILALAPVVFFAAVTQVKIQRAPVFLVFPDMLPDMLIDALVTDKGDAILRQTPADLIGTPLLLRQSFFDQLHQIWRHFARLVRGLFASLRGLLVRLLEAIAARAGVANKLAADRRRIDANLPRDVGLRVAALQERVNLAALFAGQMEIALGHFSSVRCAVPRKDSLHLTARKTGIHNIWEEIETIRREKCSYADKRFFRALHCQRFLNEAFRARTNLLGDFRPALESHIEDRVAHSMDILSAKLAVEAVGLLSEGAVQRVVLKALERDDPWITETCVNACRYLPALPVAVLGEIWRGVVRVPESDFFRDIDRLRFIFGLSSGLLRIRTLIDQRFADIVSWRRWRWLPAGLLGLPIILIFAPCYYFINLYRSKYRELARQRKSNESIGFFMTPCEFALFRTALLRGSVMGLVVVSGVAAQDRTISIIGIIIGFFLYVIVLLCSRRYPVALVGQEARRDEGFGSRSSLWNADRLDRLLDRVVSSYTSRPALSSGNQPDTDHLCCAGLCDVPYDSRYSFSVDGVGSLFAAARLDLFVGGLGVILFGLGAIQRSDSSWSLRTRWDGEVSGSHNFQGACRRP